MSREQELAERRDREIERTGSRRIGTPFDVKVVGVSFTKGYPDNLHELDRLARRANLVAPPYSLGEMAQERALEEWEAEGGMFRRPEPLPAILVRNPENEYDANAIEVHVPALGEEWGMIGHLTRPIAARMAPEMDAGGRFVAEVVSVLIDPDFPDRPGISIHVDRAPEEEQ